VALFFASAGSAAASFSGDGFETTDFGGTDTAQGIAIGSGGKIVVAGSTTAGAGAFDFAVARFTRSGNLDDSFAENGRTTTGFYGRSDQAFDVAIQPNGRIVVVGTTNASGKRGFALARYRRSGALDDWFSRNGKASPDFARVAYGVAIQENGRIVVAGVTKDDFALARFKRNGDLDDSFSGNGKITTDFGRDDETTRMRRRKYDSASDVVIQPNGRIVVVGTTHGACRFDCFALARYRQNGRLDRSFAGDGKRIVKFHGGATAEGVAVQENGRIVVAGAAGTYCAFDVTSCGFAVTRLKEDGGLDHSFGEDNLHRPGRTGKTVTGPRGVGASAFDLAIPRNGRIVVVGQTEDRSQTDFALVRLKWNGQLDDSFSGDGTQATAFGPGDEVAYDVAFQSRRKFIVTGVMSAGDLLDPAQDFLIARYRNNGELDD
jgi:uncharacterized delta-60 repeat protein